MSNTDYVKLVEGEKREDDTPEPTGGWIYLTHSEFIRIFGIDVPQEDLPCIEPADFENLINHIVQEPSEGHEGFS